MTAGWRIAAIVLAVCVIAIALLSITRVQDWLIDAAIHRLAADRFVDLPPYETDAQPVQTVKVRMRDGVLLETHIYLPEGKGPWPVILVRDPYSLSKYFSCKI
ncbi:MAG: CocE/NonD family hydrolase, partial [Candidatus Binataceae bacterium]